MQITSQKVRHNDAPNPQGLDNRGVCKMQTANEKYDSKTTRIEARSFTSPWMDSNAAASYLGCSPGTLKTWRSKGEGPAYHIVNQKLVRYHVSDLDAFVRGEVAR